jgi:surface protein
MALLRLDQIITFMGLTIGFSVHLYLAFLAAAHFPYTLLLESQYNRYTILVRTEPFAVPRPLNLDVGIDMGIVSNQQHARRKLSVQQKTDRAVFVNKGDLKQAVDLWISDKTRAQELYGRHISDWNVSMVTDMSLLFRGATNFSEDLNQWNVSLVHNMSGMFHDAGQFQSNLSSWQVSNVKDFSHTFHGAASFDGDLSTWDDSSAVDYTFMFSNAASFRGNLSTWTTAFNKYNYSGYSYEHSNLRRPVSKEPPSFPYAQRMESMFENATSFDSDLTLWEMGAVVNTRAMFRNAIHFDGGDLRDWNVSAVRDFAHMFDGADMFSGQLCWRVTDGADMTDMMKGSPSSFDVDCDDDTGIIG